MFQKVVLILTLTIRLSFCETERNEFCDTDSCSNGHHQLIIDEDLNNLQQDDPKLIEAIKKIIIPKPPIGSKYNFSSRSVNLNGQFDQPNLIEPIFKDVKNGFFIEAGAYDGEEISNTLHFELVKGWTGLLVEPNPEAFAQLVLKKRKAHLIGHCFSTKTTPETVDFDAAGLFGGITNGNKKPGDFVEDSRAVRNRPKDYKPKYNRRTIRIQCFPLYSILLALGNPKVDIFSLDIEGAELQVLKTIPWDKVNISSLLIEINHIGEIFEGTFHEMRKLLKDNGYKLYKNSEIDQIYVRREILNKYQQDLKNKS